MMARDYYYSAEAGTPKRTARLEDTLDFWRRQQEKNAADFRGEAERAADAYRQELNDAYTGALDTARESATAGQRQLDAELRELYDANRVEELVGQRNVAERMANLGLTQSGYNATNQTAIALRRANADADARRQRQTASEALTQALFEREAALGLQRGQQLAEVGYDTRNRVLDNAAAARQAAMQAALSQYGTELSQEEAGERLDFQRAEANREQANTEWEQALRQQQWDWNRQQEERQLAAALASEEAARRAAERQAQAVVGSVDTAKRIGRGYAEWVKAGQLTREQAMREIISTLQGMRNADEMIEAAAKAAGLEELLAQMR